MIRNEDAASLMRLRTPQGLPAQAQEMRISQLGLPARRRQSQMMLSWQKGAGCPLRDHGHLLEKRGSDTNDPGGAWKCSCVRDNK